MAIVSVAEDVVCDGPACAHSAVIAIADTAASIVMRPEIAEKIVFAVIAVSDIECAAEGYAEQVDAEVA